jgi:putative DNA primase/helicase
MSGAKATTLVDLVCAPQWVAWRPETRDEKTTKVPYCSAQRKAQTNNPSTWTTHDKALLVAKAIRNGAGSGVGIVLGLCGKIWLFGIDLDSCRDPKTGIIQPWAATIIQRFASYTEVSPSGTGVKVFMCIDTADASELQRLMDGKTGRQFKQKSNADHPPAIELYISHKYFTVTEQALENSPNELRTVPLDDVRWLIKDAGPAFAAKSSANSKSSSTDGSRSATAFRKGAALRRAGKTFEEMCEALRTDPDTAEWCREKGDANDGRELRRIWEKTEQHAIIVQAGLRHEAADAGLAAMHAAGVEYYQRDRTLVRVCAVSAKASDGSAITSPGIVNVSLPMLARGLGQSARWEKMNEEGEKRRIDPPKEVVEQIGGMLGEWPFDSLSGVIGTQTLRPDGSRLFTEGYDCATGLYLLAPSQMPEIPDQPTKQDALNALALLDALLVDFPFADKESRAVAMSMLMTPVLRGALPPAVPIHAVTAPEAGTGKSYLGDIASAIANGERCAVQSVAPKEDETEKRLIGAALAGLPIIALDNCNGVLHERPSMRVRPLGGSGLVRLSNTYTVFVNGNNITVAADLTRRTIRCMLDAQTDDTTTRVFTGDPVATVLADRGRYVAAVLTIALAYLAAGQPNPPRPLPSFERWSRLVCGALMWLEWDNPMDTMIDIRGDDPSRQQLAAVLDAWPTELTSYSTAELIEAAMKCHDNGSGPIYPAWLEAMKDVARNRQGIFDPTILGIWLRNHRDRMSGKRKLTREGTPTRPQWKVTQVWGS